MILETDVLGGTYTKDISLFTCMYQQKEAAVDPEDFQFISWLVTVYQAAHLIEASYYE